MPDDVDNPIVRIKPTVIHCICGKPTHKRYNLNRLPPPERLDSCLCAECDFIMRCGNQYISELEVTD